MGRRIGHGVYLRVRPNTLFGHAALLPDSQIRTRRRRYDDQIEQGKQDKPLASEWTWIVDGFLERTRGTVRDSSLKELRVSLEVFGELAEPKTPRAVNQQAAKRFVQRAVDSGRSVSTVNKHLSCLCRAWNSEFPNHPNPF